MTIQPPKASRKPHSLEIHNDVRVDHYYWLRDRENQEVIDYLTVENAYTDEMLAPVKELREALFVEMKSRIKEQDESVPVSYTHLDVYKRQTGSSFRVKSNLLTNMLCCCATR